MLQSLPGLYTQALGVLGRKDLIDSLSTVHALVPAGWMAACAHGEDVEELKFVGNHWRAEVFGPPP